MGTRQIKTWHAWLIIGLAAGSAAGVILLADQRSEVGEGQPRQPTPTPSFLFGPPLPQNPFRSTGAEPRATVNCARGLPAEAEDSCWQIKAVNDKNAAFCENIKTVNPFTSRDGCVNLVAQAKKDASLCARIQNPDIKKNCEENAK